ncbi:metallophosphoesterase [Halocynthia phage JM-2012]|uniref:metallophosphoesterase n=1 Tax=Halocynthia phage JM-2012 TaxID=1173297 RepID=UPI00025C68F0|nr:metallophosphoesterase [Halocynthia phage JM-2012]AFI55316.1 metallophosphoesterase [Halocynthia phage JM-2012]
MTSYVESIRMVGMTNNVCIMITKALNAKRDEGVEIKPEHEEVLEALTSGINKTIDTLEELEREYISSPPAHFVGNSLKVDQWTLDLNGQILDATGWMGSIQGVYRELIETYELDLNQPKVEEAPELSSELTEVE